MKKWLVGTLIGLTLIFHVQAAEPFARSIVMVDHPVSTSNPQAQLNFNEGLTEVFGFNHDLAFLKFEKAAQEDPTLAMAYWGMAYALGQNINQEITPENEKRAYALSQKALSLISKASPAEQDYIQALAVRYTNNPKRDLVQLRHRYSDAMEKLVKKYPEDLDATCLYAESILDLDPWKYWSWDGHPAKGTMEAIEVLESVLRRDPNSLAANHFYVHAWEASPTPERALISAFRLTILYPYGGHVLHMPCHIFLLCGYYEDAVVTSKKAIAMDRKYIQEYGMNGLYPLHYLSHNLKVLTRAYMLWGDYDGAIQTAQELQQFLAPYYKQDGHFAKSMLQLLDVNLYFQKWREVLRLPVLETSDPYTQSYFHFGRALASIRLEDSASYQKERDQMIEFQGKIQSTDEVAHNPATKIIDFAALLLDAEEVRDNQAEYISKLQKIVDVQDRLNYDEPPAWYIPVRLELGRALLNNKSYAEAEKVFKKGLQEHQRNGRFLDGLHQSLKAQNRTWEAFWVESELSKAIYQNKI